MSTRCQIGFYEKEEMDLNKFELLIYRHSDGYPEGVLPELLPVLKDFDKNRGLDDLEYASAWVVAKFKDNYLNIGISRDFHGDIEYLYKVTPINLTVFAVKFNLEGNTDINKKVSLIKVIDLRR